MKKSLLIVLFTLALGVISGVAQERKHFGRMKKDTTHMRREHKRLSVNDRADRMARELDLTEEQKAEVVVLFQKQDAERIKFMEERKKMTEARKTERELSRKAQDEELEKIIGKDKLEEYKKNRLEHRNAEKHYGRVNKKMKR